MDKAQILVEEIFCTTSLHIQLYEHILFVPLTLLPDLKHCTFDELELLLLTVYDMKLNNENI